MIKTHHVDTYTTPTDQRHPTSMSSTTRLVALRLEALDSLVVKEPHTPVAFKLNLTDPLSDAQLHMLTLASPWKPMNIESTISGWNERLQCFDATISVIETPSKKPTPQPMKQLKWGQVKRKRGFVSHD